jgi:four helix bundle protein
MRCAPNSSMPGWTSPNDIIAYRLAVKLRDRVLGLIDSGTIPFNFHLRDQIADAARSAPANISEGFERYKHGQFGYHVGVAKGSLGELKTHLEEVHTRRFLNDETFLDLLGLLVEAKRATSGLLKHLRKTEAPEPWADDDEDADAKERH